MNPVLTLRPVKSKSQARLQCNLEYQPRTHSGARDVDAVSILVVWMVDEAKPQPSLPRACTDSSLFALRGMDHCADDLLAETRLLELQEIVRVELELGRRDFDLIDDDLVAKSGLFELEHIRVG